MPCGSCSPCRYRRPPRSPARSCPSACCSRILSGAIPAQAPARAHTDDSRPGGSMLCGAMDWLRGFFPGYFALVMGTGIIAVAAHLLRHVTIGWTLFAIALLAYVILWIILLARMSRFPREVIKDFATHDRGPAFLTIVAATGVLGSQLDTFGVL